MRRYTVVFKRESDGWWNARVKEAPAAITQGRSIDEARRRIREALALAVGDTVAERAELVDDVRVPKELKRLLKSLEKARKREESARAEARKAASRVARTLTKRMRLSRRDVAALTGYSFQRIHQLVEG